MRWLLPPHCRRPQVSSDGNHPNTAPQVQETCRSNAVAWSGTGYNDSALMTPHSASSYQLTLICSSRQCCAPSLFVRLSYFESYFSPNITDGTSSTLIVGEMQRVKTPWPSFPNAKSEDGWAYGGIATLFDTDTEPNWYPGGLNNGWYQSAGSSHVNGSHFCMADGSVRFISMNIDEDLYQQLGSRGEGIAVGDFLCWGPCRGEFSAR